MKPLFSYLDYRDYLKDHYDEQKELHSYFSYRYVASKTGIDASFYSKILLKTKQLSEQRIDAMASFLELGPQEKLYFSTLVLLNRSRNTEQSKELLAKLLSLKNSAGEQISDYRYFSEWYTIPIRELLNHYDFDGENFQKLAQQFSPALTQLKVRNSITTLLKLNMIAPDTEGFLRPTETIITTGDQWQSKGIQQFQNEMILRASDALLTLPKEQRDISTVTVSTSKACLSAIRERLAVARREILELIALEEEVDGVYQINLQVFPLTKEASQ